uniref:ATP synthase F0 subunit 8 n=1 Tax=Colposcenia ignota TaxID=3230277 RepID=A0AAU8G645_9HEMI
MPQMSPTLWTLVMLMTLTVMLLISSILYFYYKSSIKRFYNDNKFIFDIWSNSKL